MLNEIFDFFKIVIFIFFPIISLYFALWKYYDFLFNIFFNDDINDRIIKIKKTIIQEKWSKRQKDPLK